MLWYLIVDEDGKPGSVNMAIDQTLLARAQDGMACLRLYRWKPPCLSFGRHEPALRRYSLRRIRERNLDTVRRPTGGRAVWHEHEVTYAVAAPIDTFGSLRETYLRIHSTLTRALNRLGVAASHAPRTPAASLGSGSCFATAAGGEILANGRKLVGSAQLRERNAFLQHGSILLDDGQDMIKEISRMPHAPINATSLTGILGRPIRFDEVCEAIADEARLSWDGDWQMPGTSPPPESCFNFDDPAWTWVR
jgi:lipoate-protein ligase A